MDTAASFGHFCNMSLFDPKYYHRSQVTRYLCTKAVLSRAFKNCKVQMLRLHLWDVNEKNNSSEINASICIVPKMKNTLIKVISKMLFRPSYLNI